MTPITLAVLIVAAVGSTPTSAPSLLSASLAEPIQTPGVPSGSTAATPAGQSGAASPTTPSTDAGDATGATRWYRVSAGNAFVRSDASATVAYPIGRIAEGTMLAVVEERFGWARIHGDKALGDLHGFIPAETAAVSEDGRFVVVSVRTPLKAANLAARQDPARSWKEVARVEPGDRLQLVETVGSDGDAFHKVVLPDSAAAWINLAFLSPATPDEIRSMQADSSADAAPSEGGDLELIASSNEEGPAIPATTGPAPAVVTAGVRTLGEETLLEGPTAEGDVAFVDIDAVEADADLARLAEPRLEDLESIWTRISEAPETPASDVEELRGRYVALASSESSTAAVRARAKLRSEQILLQQQIQNRLTELRRLQEENLMNLQAIRDVREVIESRTDYEAVGRLNTSLVYDGRRLPLLYRLQEPGEGATVADIIPTSDIRLAELTGQLVGVDGVVRYDEALRLNIITPDRVDVLQDGRP
jgi:hypothetical protein